MQEFSRLKACLVLALLLSALILPRPAAAIDLFNNRVGSGAKAHTFSFSSKEEHKTRPHIQAGDFRKANADSKAATTIRIRNAVAARQAQTAKTVGALRATSQKEIAARQAKNAAAVKEAQAQRAAAWKNARAEATAANPKTATAAVTPAVSQEPAEATPDLFNTPSSGTGGSKPIFGVQ